MGRNAYDISIRETLQHRGAGVTLAVCLFGAAIAIAGYNFWPFGHRANFSEVFYSDDDGQSYFKASVYKFPPFDHDGRTANEAIVILDHGSKVVGYLERYTPEARKKLMDKYSDDVNNHRTDLEIQHDVLTFMHDPDIYLRGQECKLPGPGNQWCALRSAPRLSKPPAAIFPRGRFCRSGEGFCHG